jgi:hypothetical protein
MDPEKLKSMQEWPLLEDKQKFRCYYQRFIVGFCRHCKAAGKLMEEKQTFQCSPEGEVAFQSIKNSQHKAPRYKDHI